MLRAEKRRDIGPGVIHRIARDLQKKYFDPPQFHGSSGSKYD